MIKKIKSIDHTMIPLEYTELNHEEWRDYIHNCVCENKIINQVNQIINPEPDRVTQKLTPKQMANGDLVTYAIMFAFAICLALYITLKS